VSITVAYKTAVINRSVAINVLANLRRYRKKKGMISRLWAQDYQSIEVIFHYIIKMSRGMPANERQGS